MCTAKGISNGFVPFGAVMIREEVAQVFESSKDPLATLSTGYTYSGHPVGAAAAIAALAEAQRLDVAANSKIRGEEMLAGFQALKSRHEVVGDVRGQGLMTALELVSDRDTRQALDKASVQKIFDAVYQAGAMVRVSGNMILVSPALIVTAAQVQQIVECLDQGLSAVA